jgi:hypothetical protein
VSFANAGAGDWRAPLDLVFLLLAVERASNVHDPNDGHKRSEPPDARHDIHERNREEQSGNNPRTLR